MLHTGAHRAQLLELVCEDGVHDGELPTLVNIVRVAVDVWGLAGYGRLHRDKGWEQVLTRFSTHH